MKYKKYPSYKDSGVEWLGDIPSHWNTKRLKNVIRASITDGPHETPEFIDEGVPFLSVDGIQEGELSFKKCRYISEDAHNLYKRKAFIELDDILLGKAASIGKVARVKVDFEFSIWSPLALIKPKLDEIIPSYLEYLLKSDLTQYQIQQLSTSNTQQNISMADIPKFNFSLPELKEQQQIANFLDKATAKIDTLIEKQTKQIELLKEKRQAVISHAVTKGINPNVPMKDSGVEWLGEIPEHWITPKLIYISSRIGDGLHSTPLYEDNTGFYFINGNNLINGNILFRNTSKEVSELEYVKHFIRLNSNSLLLSINGTIGNVALYNDEKIILGKSAAYINCLKKMNREFLLFYLQSNCAKRYYDIEVTGTTIFNLSLNSIRKMNIALPPYLEQHQIIRYCREMQFKYNTLIQKSNKSIGLLKEKRTALISAAVTGKIDVREFE